MTDFDELPFDSQPGPPTLATVTERKHRHRWVAMSFERWQELGIETSDGAYECAYCHKPIDVQLSRRGRTSRSYGNRAELAASRKYGGEKIGAAGGPVDIRGKDFNTQVKTHRRLPPLEWTKASQAMSASRERIPRLLLRFVGTGVPPRDYFVFEADDFLAWFGRDE